MEDRILEDMVLRSRSNALHWAIRNGGLTEDEQKTVYMLLQDMLQREIGEKLGCSQGHVSAMRKSALGKSERLFRMLSGMARASGPRNPCNSSKEGWCEGTASLHFLENRFIRNCIVFSNTRFGGKVLFLGGN